MTDTQILLDKYHDVIAEEINVKKIGLLDEHITVTTQYIPLGKELSASFGKDTGQIISAAKQGNVESLEDAKIKVFNDGNEWILESHQYELRYSGLQGDNQIVEDGVIVELDLEVTDDLHREGIAREMSRFLNQMRKDADYSISDRVVCFFQTESDVLAKVLKEFTDFLKGEALLSDIISRVHEGDITSDFESDEGSVVFVLKK